MEDSASVCDLVRESLEHFVIGFRSHRMRIRVFETLIFHSLQKSTRDILLILSTGCSHLRLSVGPIAGVNSSAHKLKFSFSTIFREPKEGKLFFAM